MSDSPKTRSPSPRHQFFYRGEKPHPAHSIFASVTFALIVCAVLITAFLLSVGWFRPLFGPQPVRVGGGCGSHQL